MAVEAHHHLRLFPLQQQLVRSRDIVDTMQTPQQSGVGQMFYGNNGGSFIPLYNPEVCLPTADPVTGSESGITVNDVLASAAAPARKRQRVMSFLGEDVSSQLQRQQLEIDRVVCQHTERVRSELAEQRKRFSDQILMAVEEQIRSRLRAKAEEIELIGKVNLVLQERIQSLTVENQFWRDLAQTHEAAANALRSNLERVLAAQQVHGVAAAVEDAESCCGGDDEREDGAETVTRVCRRCGMREPTVLILPCRHLCVCVACSPETNFCPVCQSCKHGSVLVNIS